jgi:tRNA A-37 threonylcarbamoyl transferase component Bud32/tetratricopeptide (TPR) repeat protein
MIPTQPDAELERGAAVGRYTILALVGRGAMGKVYAAYDPHLDRKVALKLMHADGARGAAETQARLLREAKALARLSHRHVVAVHDTGTFEGRVFVAMEFVDGVTLEAWLAERPRSRPEILAVFAAAARGLAAAHAAGLVHRDFKPTNVMIGDEGSVRVTDFGLARATDEPGDEAPPPAAPAPDASPRDPRLSDTSELLGTPLFMSPEQLAHRPTDARSDQFGFCVALYRALYGAHPFRGETIGALTAAVLAGAVEPAPPGASVPGWLRRAVVRGLSLDPAARWASMNELIAALERDPTQRRKRWGLAAGVALLVGLSLWTLARGANRTAALCLGGPARLDGVWEGAAPDARPLPRRDAVEKAFLASGAPGARDVWERAAALLDRYRADWLAMYHDACEAHHVRREQSAALLDLRMACLDERRLALSSLTDVLATADRDVVKSAVDAANALPPLARCADRGQLETPVESPRDEATRRRVEDLRRRAAIVKAMNDTGKHEQAAKLARDQVAEARAIGYRPLVAELLMAYGRTRTFGSYTPDMLPVQEDTVYTALGVGRDDLAAEAAVALVAGVGNYFARFDEGRAWARTAEGLLDRAGSGHELLRAWLLANEAMIDSSQHETGRAIERIERSLAIKEKVLPPGHPDIAMGMNNEADALAQLGRNEESLALERRAHDMFVRAYGPDSTEAAFTLNNMCEVLIALGRPAEAIEPSRRSLALWEAQVGPTNPFLGFPLTALGRALVALGRPKEALPPLERALRLREAGEHDPSSLAQTRFALACALWDAKADRTRALSLAKAARSGFHEGNAAKDVAEVDAWLARNDEVAAPR